jgi:hypothetical protein
MDGSMERARVRSARLLPRWLLLAGLAAGAGLAASGLITGENRALPPQAVARVNDRLILRDAWLRAVAAVAGERRGELTGADWTGWWMKNCWCSTAWRWGWPNTTPACETRWSPK